MRSFRTATVITLVFLAVAGCSSGPAAKTAAKGVYGPAGHQFSVAFPSAPRMEMNSKALLEGLPKGTTVYGFEVSPAANVFANNGPTPRPPTYAVAVAVLSSRTQAQTFVHLLTIEPGFTVVKVRGVTAYEFIGPESSKLYQGTKPTDPNASEGTLILVRGTALFVCRTVTAKEAETRAFFSTFKPA